jgi:hypothetical protein
LSNEESPNIVMNEQRPLSCAMLEQIAYLWSEEFRDHVRTSIGEEGEDVVASHPLMNE